MKIESKHGTRKPAYTAAATLLAATTLVTGCGLQYEGNLTEYTPYSELQYEGDLTEYTPETIALPSRRYFENVDKSYTRDDIVREIGGYDEWDGSQSPVGFIWQLENNEKAKLHFGKNSLLDAIIITSNGSEKVLYVRHIGLDPENVIKMFFDSFKTSDFESMKSLCTEFYASHEIYEDNISGIRQAELLECDKGKYDSKYDQYTFNVTVSVASSKDSEKAEAETKEVRVTLVRNKQLEWKIDAVDVSN